MFRKAQANSSAFFAVLVLRRCRMKSVKLAERVYRNLQKQQDLLAECNTDAKISIFAVQEKLATPGKWWGSA